MTLEILRVVAALQSAKSIIKAELQLLQSIISPGRDKLCCHSPYCLLLHMLITPGALNHPPPPPDPPILYYGPPVQDIWR